MLPDLFSCAGDFDKWFDSEECLNGNNEIVMRLHAILRPFMLRRMKSVVEKSLLPIVEMKLCVGMTVLQRETYKKILMKDVSIINALCKQAKKSISNLWTELRKVANHPYLVPDIEPGPPYTEDQHLVDNCGKMMVLDQLLAKLKSQGSRVLLFSQFKIVLNLLEDYFSWRGYKYCRFDGNTSHDDRQALIDDFNAENSDKFLFIATTRAGSLGE